jgi:hypothetical protein
VRPLDQTLEPGDLVREESALSVYYWSAGVLWGFPSLEALAYAGKTMGDVQIVPDGSLVPLRKAPVDGTLVQDGGRTGRLYITFDGVKFDLTEVRYLALGADRDAIVAVPWGTLDGLPDGGPFTGLLKKPRLGPIVVGARRRLYSRRGLRVRGQVEGFVVGVIAALVVALITR